MVFSIFSVLIIVIILLYELYNRSTSLVMWISVMMFFGFGHIIYCLSGGISEKIAEQASIFVILFCVLYFITRLLLKHYSKSKLILVQVSETEEAPFNEDRFAAIFFIILIISTIIYCGTLVRFTGSVSQISKYAVYDYRYSSGIVLLVNYAWSAGVPAFLWYLLNGKKVKATISALAIAMMSFFSGTRTQLIALFVMIVLYYIFSGKKIGIKKAVVLALVGLIAVYFMLALRSFRYYYFFSDLRSISLDDINSKIILLNSQKSGDIYLYSFFYKLIEINNDYPGLGVGNGCLRLILLPIPSSLSFGLKPEDICLTLGKLFGGSNSVNYSVTPTLFGDAYANYGMFGVVLGIPWAIIMHFLDKLCIRKTYCLRVFFSATIAWALINIGRGDVYNAIAGIYYTVIIYGIVMLYVKHTKSIRIVCGRREG